MFKIIKKITKKIKKSIPDCETMFIEDDNLMEYFKSEYKKNPKEAYQYWIYSKKNNYYS